MNLEARKYHLIEKVMKLKEPELRRVEAFMDEENLDSELEQELTARAIQSEYDISSGKIYTLQEAEERLNRQLGL